MQEERKREGRERREVFKICTHQVEKVQILRIWGKEILRVDTRLPIEA